MHGGAAGEGYWLGDDAKMQFELILDIFDIKFNCYMPWIIDPLKATTMDLAAVTDVQRAAFLHGLAVHVQGDRSQGHLKMAMDCTIRKNPRGKQPHFRHTFSPLPRGYTHRVTGGSADWPCAPTPCRANLHVQHAKRQS